MTIVYREKPETRKDVLHTQVPDEEIAKVAGVRANPDDAPEVMRLLRSFEWEVRFNEPLLLRMKQNSKELDPRRRHGCRQGVAVLAEQYERKDPECHLAISSSCPLGLSEPSRRWTSSCFLSRMVAPRTRRPAARGIRDGCPHYKPTGSGADKVICASL